MLLLQLLDGVGVLPLPLGPPDEERFVGRALDDFLVPRRQALPNVHVEDDLADGDVLVHARRVVILPDVVETQAQVLHAAHPLGAVDHAALRRRDDLAAGHVDGGHAHALEHLRGHAGLPALHALEVGEVLDRPLEPAEGLRPGRQDRQPVDVELELLLEELVAQVVAAAVVHPAHRVDHVHAEGPAGAAGAQDRRLVLADPVARPGVRTVDHLLVRGVEHFERRHHLSGRHGVDLQRAIGELADTLDEIGEVLVEREASRPGGLHFQIDRLLRLRRAARCGQRRRRDKRFKELPHGDPPPLRWFRKAKGRLHGDRLLVQPSDDPF